MPGGHSIGDDTPSHQPGTFVLGSQSGKAEGRSGQS
nr:MAG TPA: hypothetical protein [Caudoviricetes sp.]